MLKSLGMVDGMMKMRGKRKASTAATKEESCPVPRRLSLRRLAMHTTRVTSTADALEYYLSRQAELTHYVTHHQMTQEQQSCPATAFPRWVHDEMESLPETVGKTHANMFMCATLDHLRHRRR